MGVGLYTKIYSYARYHGVNRLVARSLVRTLRSQEVRTIKAATILLLPPRSPIENELERTLLEAVLKPRGKKIDPDISSLDHPIYRLMER
jgi:hypothetical protein